MQWPPAHRSSSKFFFQCRHCGQPNHVVIMPHTQHTIISAECADLHHGGGDDVLGAHHRPALRAASSILIKPSLQRDALMADAASLIAFWHSINAYRFMTSIAPPRSALIWLLMLSEQRRVCAGCFQMMFLLHFDMMISWKLSIKVQSRLEPLPRGGGGGHDLAIE